MVTDAGLKEVAELKGLRHLYSGDNKKAFGGVGVRKWGYRFEGISGSSIATTS